MKAIGKYLKPYIPHIIIVIVLVIVRAFTELFIPTFLPKIVDDGVAMGNKTVIWQNAGIMLAIALVGLTAAIISGYFESRLSSNYAYDLRLAVYDKVSTFSVEELDEFQVSSLITRTTQDIQLLQAIMQNALRMLTLQPIMAIGGIVYSIKASPKLSLIIAVGVASLIIIIVTLFLLSIPKFKLMQKLIDRGNLVVRENLTGLRVIRAFNAEDEQKEKFDTVAERIYKTNRFVNITMSMMWPFMSIVMGAMAAVLIYITAQKYVNIVDGFTPAQVIVLNTHMVRVMMAFMMMTFLLSMLPRVLISVRRVADVLTKEPSIKDPEDPLEVVREDGTFYIVDGDIKTPIKGEIEFKDVTFKYPDADLAMLSNISFKVKPNETIAFIGSTGSGKSTLINLVPRFYDVTEGEILIDGYNIKQFKLRDLRDILGFVPQQGFLFKGSVRDNIAFGIEATDEEVWEAIDIAQGAFVKDLTGQLDYQISQGGTNVSGGQRQRLSIARAICKRPVAYIFDDSFSALDYKTDFNLRKRLESVPSTKLIVAQRAATVVNAEQIVVLDKGNMIAIGKHEELLETCDIYREIASSQMPEEEVRDNEY